MNWIRLVGSTIVFKLKATEDNSVCGQTIAAQIGGVTQLENSVVLHFVTPIQIRGDCVQNKTDSVNIRNGTQVFVDLDLLDGSESWEATVIGSVSEVY